MIKNLKGQRFERLEVVKMMGKNKSGNYLWECLCDCGKKIVTSGGNLTSGNTISCGCARKTHGMGDTRFYHVWEHIIQRCNNTKCRSYKNYGMRGILNKWESFEEFRDDMYPSYSEHIEKFGEKNTTLDRKDNESNYCKGNCQWATYGEQNRNFRRNHLITFNNKTQCIQDWANETGIKYNTIIGRLNRDWSIKKALNFNKNIK